MLVAPPAGIATAKEMAAMMADRQHGGLHNHSFSSNQTTILQFSANPQLDTLTTRVMQSTLGLL
jgi:hypothetical protein